MASNDPRPQQGDATHPPPPAPPSSSPSSSSSSFSENWKERIFVPTLLAGIMDGRVQLVSKNIKVHGLANMAASYATNFAIVTGCYCGAREYVRVTRKSEPDDLVNSAVAGFGIGALLGRLQGVDFATIKLRPALRSLEENKDDWLKLPDLSPIQVFDEEALVAKERGKQLFSQRALGKLSKEES